MEQTDSRFETKQLAWRIPNSLQVSAVNTRLYAAYEATRTKQLPPTEGEKMLWTQQFKAMLPDIANSPETGEDFYKDLLKTVNKAVHTLKGCPEKRVSADTPAVRHVIWIILNQLVRTKFEEMLRYSPDAFADYLCGKVTHLTLTTSTSWLAEKANLAAGTLRGNKEGSVFFALSTLDFCERSHINRDGSESDCGQEVVLKINVKKWFFGLPDAAKIDFFLPDTRRISTQIETIQVKEQITNESGVGKPTVVELYDSTKQVKGENGDTPSPKNDEQQVKSSAPRRAEILPENAKIAEKLWQNAEKALFNAENLADYKVRTNAENVISYVSETSKSVCESRMKTIVQTLADDGMSLPDIATIVQNCIKNKANELKTGKKEYIYGPEMWLRMDFNAATLWSSITAKNEREAAKIAKNTAANAAPSDTIAPNTEGGTIDDTYINWILGTGFNPLTLNAYIKTHGRHAVALQGQMTKYKIEFLGFKPAKTLAASINSALKYLDANIIEERLSQLMKKNAPKPAHIWTKWRDVIFAETTDPQIRKAWQAAVATSLSPTTKMLTIEVKNQVHADILESDEGFRLFKLAKEKTGIKYPIQFTYATTNR